MELSLQLVSWSAWASGVESAEQWHEWAIAQRQFGAPDQMPALPFIPSMQRRRFSRLSRLQLQVAYDCAAGNHHLRTIFCSRHGEIHRTHGLLAEMAKGEPLSPMAFSLSVHNTASGLYSIASGNTAPSTALAAGRDTLAMAFVEAAGQLGHAEEVMLVFGDEPLPEDYEIFSDEYTVPFGLALRFKKTDAMNSLRTIHLRRGESYAARDSAKESIESESMGLALLRLLAGDKKEVIAHGERNNWLWICT
jgi:hypothetical protein